MIVQAVDRRPLANAIESRFLLPIGLCGTIALRPGVSRPEVAAPTSARMLASAMTQPWDAGAGGPIAASPVDMLRLWRALLGGRLLRPETVDTMFATLYPMFNAGTFYGLDVMVQDFCDAGRSGMWIGHAGGSPGASAIIAYAPADRVIVAVALTGDAPAAAVANAVLKALRPLAAN
ncbi:CubicO group peptidase (beta-lactamase class C family) [Sphingomonas zeicaulis]|uniref:serine hydrolase n=1 Tax=Sphingomonas zeicaulis TaxID=1632740 RepID=UPI003D191011